MNCPINKEPVTAVQWGVLLPFEGKDGVCCPRYGDVSVAGSVSTTPARQASAATRGGEMEDHRWLVAAQVGERPAGAARRLKDAPDLASALQCKLHTSRAR